MWGTERQISPVTAHGSGHRDDYVISVNDRPIIKDLSLEQVKRILAEYWKSQNDPINNPPQDQ